MPSIQPSHSRCDVCGARLPVGTAAGFCPFCVADDGAPDEPRTRALGDYELLEVIGRGGMGIVWRARQLKLHRDVALKTLPGGDLAGAEARARFNNEARAAARLRHPNIVPVHEVGDADGVPYLVMELVEGRSLGEVIAGKPVPARVAARLLRDIAHGVEHAHTNGVLHRDLKPANILIEPGDDGGRPRITDFGLAKLADAERSLTRTGSALGSPAYMAPEQARRNECTARSDVYGLGAILYCALTGRPPFLGESIATVLSQLEADEPIPPRRLHGSVPLDLETICLKCLEKNPSRRYSSALALSEDLTRFLDGDLVLARPVGALGRVTRMAWRHPWRAAAVVLAAVALVVTGLSLLWNARAEHRHSAELQIEQAATRVALMRAQLGEARAIIRLRNADSRPRAVEIASEVLAGSPNGELRAQARDVSLAALALPSARFEPLPGEQALTDDWTLAMGDLPRERWARATYSGVVSIYPVRGVTNLLSFDTRGRRVTALIAFSPGGRWLAIRHLDELCIWDTAPGVTERLVFSSRPWAGGRQFSFTHVAFAPEDRAVAWIDGDGLNVHSLPDGAELARWRGANGAKFGAEAVAFDSSGQFLAVARGIEPAVELRSWPDGVVRRVFSGWFPEGLCALAVAPGAERIAGGDKSGRVWLWRRDGRSSSPVDLRGHSEMIRGLSFSGDGRLLASCSEDGAIRLWDCTVGDEVARLNFDAATTGFTADGSLVGVGSSGGRLAGVRIVHSPIFHRFRPEPVPEGVQAVSFFADGNSIACLGAARAFRCSVPDGRLIEEFEFPRPHSVHREVSAGGGLIVSGMEGARRYPPGDRVGSRILPGSRWGLDSLTVSGDGQWHGAADDSRQHAAIWPAGATNDAKVRLVSVGNTGCGQIALSRDGGLLAAGYRYDRGLLILDVATGGTLRRFDLSPRHAIEWSGDGRWLAACGTTFALWDTATWQQVELPALEANGPPAADVKFSHPTDGRSRWLALVTGSQRVTVMDVATRRIAATLEAPGRGLIYGLDFSRDNRWLAAASARGEVQIWDLNAVMAEARRFGAE